MRRATTAAAILAAVYVAGKRDWPRAWMREYRRRKFEKSKPVYALVPHTEMTTPDGRVVMVRPPGALIPIYDPPHLNDVEESAP